MEDAREAIDNMDQAELYGRVIKVNQAKPQKEANEGLGSSKALWEQVRQKINPLIIAYILTKAQEGYAAKYTADGDAAVDGEQGSPQDRPEDPMQGLEGLDVAGPSIR